MRLTSETASCSTRSQQYRSQTATSCCYATPPPRRQPACTALSCVHTSAQASGCTTGHRTTMLPGARRRPPPCTSPWRAACACGKHTQALGLHCKGRVHVPTSPPAHLRACHAAVLPARFDAAQARSQPCFLHHAPFHQPQAPVHSHAVYASSAAELCMPVLLLTLGPQALRAHMHAEGFRDFLVPAAGPPCAGVAA